MSDHYLLSGNFGHQVNSDIYLQTVEIQMRRFLSIRKLRTRGKFRNTFAKSGNPDETLLVSRLNRISTVCVVSKFLFQ